jgi:hypothetical protein
VLLLSGWKEVTIVAFSKRANPTIQRDSLISFKLHWLCNPNCIPGLGVAIF